MDALPPFYTKTINKKRSVPETLKENPRKKQCRIPEITPDSNKVDMPINLFTDDLLVIVLAIVSNKSLEEIESILNITLEKNFTSVREKLANYVWALIRTNRQLEEIAKILTLFSKRGLYLNYKNEYEFAIITKLCECIPHFNQLIAAILYGNPNFGINFLCDTKNKNQSALLKYIEPKCVIFMGGISRNVFDEVIADIVRGNNFVKKVSTGSDVQLLKDIYNSGHICDRHMALALYILVKSGDLNNRTLEILDFITNEGYRTHIHVLYKDSQINNSMNLERLNFLTNYGLHRIFVHELNPTRLEIYKIMKHLHSFLFIFKKIIVMKNTSHYVYGIFYSRLMKTMAIWFKWNKFYLDSQYTNIITERCLTESELSSTLFTLIKHYRMVSTDCDKYVTQCNNEIAKSIVQLEEEINDMKV